MRIQSPLSQLMLAILLEGVTQLDAESESTEHDADERQDGHLLVGRTLNERCVEDEVDSDDGSEEPNGSVCSSELHRKLLSVQKSLNGSGRFLRYSFV